jgi:hypothetical protein
MVTWMKNKFQFRNRSKEIDSMPETSVIGMYEMLALAQPDLNYDYSSLLDTLWKSSETPKVIDKEEYKSS